MRSIRRALRALRFHISTPAAYELGAYTRDYPVSSTCRHPRSR
jgi:hypothetical protein